MGTGYLIIAEKPQQAGLIAEGLGFKKKGYNWEGTLNGKKSVLLSASGHVVDYVEPKDIKNYTISWQDPEKNIPIPKNPPLKIIHKAGTTITSAIKKGDYESIICATDPDDEGARIFYNLIIYANKEKANLLVAKLSGSLLKNDVKKAFSDLKKFDIRQYYKSKIRSLLDWNYQILTAGFTPYVKKQTHDLEKGFYSVGRVQTFTLKLISDRTLAHDNYKEEYMYIPAIVLKNKKTGAQYELKLVKKNNEEEQALYKDKKIGESLIEKLLNIIPGRINVKQDLSKEHPFLFFNLLDLQKANSGINSEKVLNIADNIRNQGGLTYARTDYCELPESFRNVTELKKIIQPQANNPKYKQIVEFLLQEDQLTRITKTTKLFTKKERQHHGIITTENFYSPKGKDEEKIYDSVVENTLYSFAPPAVYMKTSISLTYNIKNPYSDEDGIVFSAQIDKALTEKGYLQFSDKKDLQKPIDAKDLEDCEVVNFVLVPELLTRPKLYTEITLKEHLTKCYKLPGLTEEEKDILKGAEGIGRPSSRDNVIKKLLERKYISKSSSSLRIEEKGTRILNYCPESLYSVRKTINMLGVLDAINDANENDAKEATNEVIDSEIQSIEKYLSAFSRTMKDSSITIEEVLELK